MSINGSPLVRKFEIEKLHGYKNVTIDFEKSVKIVIAENGAGKTTILSALDSFLRADFVGLKNIQFERISCLLDGIVDPLILEKKHINNQPVASESIQELIRHLDIDEASFIHFIVHEFDISNEHSFKSHSITNEAYARTHLDWDDLWEGCVEAHNFYTSTMSEEIIGITKILKEKLHDIEILYLPTYRRIEKPQRKIRSGGVRGSLSLARSRYRYNTSNINYGLADVEQRLSEITNDIQKKSNLGYRQISANIIDDLIFGVPAGSAEKDLPDLETLKLFFSRIGNANLKFSKNQKRIEEIYANPENTEMSSLRYFLGKLANVVSQTSQLEKTIETFVEKVNDYLSMSSDAKTLTYDSLQMKVYVKNNFTGDEVEFDDLSSGEKQVISLLSYLFLFQTKKIVLIDEPELSLSIKWQEKILPDIASAPLCSQLLAITHSPFIFDNELDSYAGPINITKVKSEA